jgi:peptide/nickel transport system substrate-binding protein
MKEILFLIILSIFMFNTPGLSIAQGNLLRICDLSDDTHLKMDPHMEFDERNDNVLNQIFEHLLEFDVDGNPIPHLVHRYRRIDNSTVQFKLRQNIIFHNGEHCDAYAVKFSIERNINPDKRSPSAHMLDSIKRVDVLDKYTFNIITTYPDGILLNRLAGFGYIVPSKYIEKNGDSVFEKHPLGTGPFKFVRWVKGKEIVLEKNRSYWMPGFPKIDQIVFRFASAQKRADMLLKGELDMITNFEPIDLERIKKATFRVIKEPSFTMMSINFNLLKPDSPFQNKKVRQAVNYAIDVNELIDKVMLGNGIRRATLGMPGEFGYNPYLKPYPYDLGKAKSLLTEGGFPNGFETSILIDDIDGGAGSVLGKVLKEQLSKVGIRLKVEGGNGAVHIVNPKFNPFVPKFDLDMFARTCPDPIAHIIFIEGKVWYASEAPWSLLNDSEFDKLYKKIIRTFDLREQTKLCHQLEEMIYEKAYSIFTYQGIKLYALREGLNYEPYITGMLYLREAFFDRLTK